MGSGGSKAKPLNSLKDNKNLVILKVEIPTILIRVIFFWTLQTLRNKFLSTF